MTTPKKLNLQDVRKYVAEHIGAFHKARIEGAAKVKLKILLKKKNPYLFKAKNVGTSEVLIRQLLDAYLSSQEETMFGQFLDALAIFICGEVYGGSESSTEGIDLEFMKDGVKYIVAIKSGPNWGNSSQQKKMKEDFRRAKRVLGTHSSKTNVVAVNGCCYGRDNKPEKDEYLKYCGQMFWEFVSGDPDMYTEIIEPLGTKAKERNEEFEEQYSALINRLTSEFSTEFCMNGVIDWAKLVAFNSSKKKA